MIFKTFLYILSPLSVQTLLRTTHELLRGEQSTSSDSQQTVQRPTALVSDWSMSEWALTLAQDNQLLQMMVTFPTLISFPPLHSSLMYVLYVNVCTKSCYRT
ncbi:hypothetical protein ILYODFUR_032913 [Ilyodon furcidens]|uniref:Secreted protein n=1 Tax=Ilyodon furcidens TaxID=33524 RepID=A0ABV0T3N7_9TELE